MKHVKSWDIFDTLIARICIEPGNVFSIVEQKSRFPNYRSYRISAEKKSNGTFSDIYEKFRFITGCSIEEITGLIDLELSTEKQQLFLIPEIYDQIQDGDILVSDMYLPPETLYNLLRHIGFNKTVKIFVSYDGKYNGWIWNTILNEEFIVKMHTGDNSYSDVNKPRQYGITTQYFGKTKLSIIEKYLREDGQIDMMRLIRYIRLNNIYPPSSYKYKMWNEQCQINIPLLFFASLILHEYIKQRGIHTVLFATRDGVHWHKIFAKMFPEYKIHYFHASRNMFSNAIKDDNKYYKKYVNNLVYDIDRTVFVDLHGTGQNVYKYFSTTFGNCPHVFIITVTKTLNELSKQDKLCYVSKSNNDHIEMLNYDIIGTLQNFDENGPVRDPPEYNLESVEAYHKCMELFLKNIDTIHIYKFMPNSSLNLSLCKYFIQASTAELIINNIARLHSTHNPEIYIPIRHELFFLAHRFDSLIKNLF
jgi:predicted HAD superfamily hydrolase